MTKRTIDLLVRVSATLQHLKRVKTSWPSSLDLGYIHFTSYLTTPD